MQVLVEKMGGNAFVSIPAPVLDAAGLHIDTLVDVREENGRIVIAPTAVDDDDLASLLARITPENLHAEVDFGLACGREAL